MTQNDSSSRCVLPWDANIVLRWYGLGTPRPVRLTQDLARLRQAREHLAANRGPRPVRTDDGR